MRLVLDSSALIEMLLEGPHGGAYLKAAEEAEALIVPAVCLHETYRFVAAHKDEPTAEDFAATLRNHQVCDLDGDLALQAARLGRRHKLALADSMVYATARAYDAVLMTQDADFKDLPGVRYFPKKKA